MSAVPNKLYQWLDARLSLSTWQQLAEKKKVPIHRHSIWYYMGGIAMVLLLIQVVTGGLLMVYYVPEISAAYSSILGIQSKVAFGWFIRSLHSWGANLFIFILFVHLFSTYLMKAYRSPRELTWLSGLGLLVLAFGFGFTGYLLPWDEVAFFASKIGIDITSKLPWIGESAATLLRGGETVGQATLSRFFVIHVFLLPALLVGLLGFHLLMIQLQGISEPRDFNPNKEEAYEAFFPTFVLKDLMIWLVVVNVLAALVCLFPWGLGKEADPFAAAPLGIKPEWYFLAMFQFLKLLPATIAGLEGEQLGLLFFALIGLGFALIPFWDKGGNGEPCKTRSQIAQWFGIVILLGFVFFTIWGCLA